MIEKDARLQERWWPRRACINFIDRIRSRVGTVACKATMVLLMLHLLNRYHDDCRKRRIDGNGSSMSMPLKWRRFEYLEYDGGKGPGHVIFMYTDETVNGNVLNSMI